ncbi:MAG: hypothetical protein NWT02_09850 [Opitutales bacterium]|jgi:hypothetical protein|nr:hypothetical protein [Opitutales bacterium]MDP4645378.1 hypothetical protein [Opitutales bacterium]MDP4777415.1 hypothetical protein [Opitutales bacterium]MDP4882937.1 hypothetical protein [Opitutales bacterium]MDP5080242.1 hypothetical protein [Opitutales bacterium]
MKIFQFIAVFILGVGAGYLAYDSMIGSPKANDLNRNLVWGENYYDPSDEAVDALKLLDLPGLEKLFGAAFDKSTPMNINEHTSLMCCPVQFRDHVYLLTAPLGVGSFGNTVFGYDFYIRDARKPSHDTDISFTVVFNAQRQIRSVAFRDGIFGSTRQVNVNAGAPATELASATRREMRRAMRGDGNSDDYWNYMPNLMEKLVVAIDSHIIR